MGLSKLELEKKFNDEFWDIVPEIKHPEISFIGSVLKSSENRLRDLFAYCLSPNDGHNINHIFFEALSNCIFEKGINFNINDFYSDYEITTELPTENGGRIDLLIKTTEPWSANRRAIIIEMKMESILHNNLDDYFNSISDCREENKIGIVLGINDINLTIEHDKFIFISIINYFKQIKSLFAKETLHAIHINQFFIDLFAYADKLSKHFLEPDTQKHLKFLFENRTNFTEIDTALIESESNNELRLWYYENKRGIEKIRLIKKFVKDGIFRFIQDWTKVNDRYTYIGENGKAFFRCNGSALFKDLYRFSLDYSNCLKAESLIILKLEFFSDFETQLAFGYEAAFIFDLFRDHFSLNNEADFSNKNNWICVFNTHYTDSNLISDFYSFFYESIIPQVNQIESFIQTKLFEKFKTLRQDIFFKDGLSKMEIDTSALIDTIKDKTAYRKLFDNVFLTINWYSVSRLSVSIWSISPTQDLTEHNLISSKLSDWKSHDAEESDCFYPNVDIMDNNTNFDIYRNFTTHIKFENLMEVNEIMKIKAIETSDLVKEIKRLQNEELNSFKL